MRERSWISLRSTHPTPLHDAFPSYTRTSGRPTLRSNGRIAMEVNLVGRTAVITGASKGIGLAIAKRFAGAGAEVAIIARGREALDDAVKTIRASSRAPCRRGASQRCARR